MYMRLEGKMFRTVLILIACVEDLGLSFKIVEDPVKRLEEIIARKNLVYNENDQENLVTTKYTQENSFWNEKDYSNEKSSSTVFVPSSSEYVKKDKSMYEISSYDIDDFWKQENDFDSFTFEKIP